MSNKCPAAIGRERSPQKDVKKMSHPYCVLEKCQKNVPRHCGRQDSRRRETRGRILTVSVTNNLVALTPKSLTPCHLPGVSLLCSGEARTNASRRPSVRLPISCIYISRIWCADIETKKVMYEGSIQFGNGWRSASMRLACGQYTAACMGAIYIY